MVLLPCSRSLPDHGFSIDLNVDGFGDKDVWEHPMPNGIVSFNFYTIYFLLLASITIQFSAAAAFLNGDSAE